jgi:hypothetical protein
MMGNLLECALEACSMAFRHKTSYSMELETMHFLKNCSISTCRGEPSETNFDSLTFLVVFPTSLSG